MNEVNERIQESIKQQQNQPRIHDRTNWPPLMFNDN